MKCVICKDGSTHKGLTSATFEREGMLLVIKQVPAEICSNCGEAYLSSEVSEIILETAEKAFQAGIQVEICRYKAA